MKALERPVPVKPGPKDHPITTPTASRSVNFLLVYGSRHYHHCQLQVGFGITLFPPLQTVPLRHGFPLSVSFPSMDNHRESVHVFP